MLLPAKLMLKRKLPLLQLLLGRLKLSWLRGLKRPRGPMRKPTPRLRSCSESWLLQGRHLPSCKLLLLLRLRRAGRGKLLCKAGCRRFKKSLLRLKGCL